MREVLDPQLGSVQTTGGFRRMKTVIVYCGFQGGCEFKYVKRRNGTHVFKRAKIICTWSETCNQQTDESVELGDEITVEPLKLNRGWGVYAKEQPT